MFIYTLGDIVGVAMFLIVAIVIVCSYIEDRIRSRGKK
jgi:hypothetical protein